MHIVRRICGDFFIFLSYINLILQIYGVIISCICNNRRYNNNKFYLTLPCGKISEKNTILFL